MVSKFHYDQTLHIWTWLAFPSYVFWKNYFLIEIIAGFIFAFPSQQSIFPLTCDIFLLGNQFEEVCAHVLSSI